MAKLLKSDDGRQGFQIATALERLGPNAKEAVPALIERLKDKEIGRVSPDPAIRTLTAIGPDAKEAVPALLELLKKRERLIDKDVMIALGAIGPGAKEAVPDLIRHSQDRSVYSRAAAARALGRIGPSAMDAVSTLTKMIGDEDKKGRVWAAFALARITGDHKPRVAYLIELWEEDQFERPFDSVQFDIAQALELLGANARPARDILLEAVMDEKTPAGTRMHVARALGNFHDDLTQIVPKMIALLGRPAKGLDRVANCQAAAETLGMLGMKACEAIPALQKVLEDDENDAVDAARRALEKIAKE